MYSFGDRTDGVKMIYPQHMEPFEAFCDQTTKGGGWTVFQKRLDGSVDFYRNWTDYKQGFGNLSGEFWLGLDKIHRLTSQTNNKLRVELEDFDGNTSYAEYDTFAVADETDNYTLSVGNYSGKCGQVWSISVVVLADSFAKCIFGPQLARFYKLARTKIGLYKEGGVGREIFELRPSPSLRCSEQNGEYQFRAPDKKLLFKRIFQNIHWLRDHSVGNEHECILDVNRTSILQYLQRLGGMFSSQALRVIHWRCTIRWPSAPKTETTTKIVMGIAPRCTKALGGTGGATSPTWMPCTTAATTRLTLTAWTGRPGEDTTIPLNERRWSSGLLTSDDVTLRLRWMSSSTFI